MSIYDIRSSTGDKITKIQFADGETCKASFITRLDNGAITLEDKDEDEGDYRIAAADVDNFIKARDYARSLGWNI